MENQELPKDAAALKELSVSKQFKVADELGKQVLKMMMAAEKRANKLLKNYGFQVTATLEFREVNKDEESR